MTDSIRFTCIDCGEEQPAIRLSLNVSRAHGMTKRECCQELHPEQLFCADCDPVIEDSAPGWAGSAWAGQRVSAQVYSGCRIG